MREWWKDDQALAYAIVEQGRISAETLLGAASDPEDRRRLESAHRGFGVAGYAISDEMPGGVRPALYVLVAESGPVRLPGPRGASQTLLFAVHASAAIERCFEMPLLLGQMQVAHRAVRQAHTALTALLGIPRAAQLTLDATRAGHLERQWQQLKLRPRSLAVTLSADEALAPA